MDDRIVAPAGPNASLDISGLDFAGIDSGDAVALAQNGRITLFRGGAGPVHHKGLSRTPSVDKAIWYAARQVGYHDLSIVAVYAAMLDVTEIYCRHDRYDIDLIACRSAWWLVDVLPQQEFRVDRPH